MRKQRGVIERSEMRLRSIDRYSDIFEPTAAASDNINVREAQFARSPRVKLLLGQLFSISWCTVPVN